jgi:hypothetical protein
VWVVLAGHVGVIDAANGRVVATMKGSARMKWLAALTDRDPAAGNGCPGGSSARMPFGVLTRTEERYTVPAGGRSRNNERDVHVDVPDNDEV